MDYTNASVWVRLRGRGMLSQRVASVSAVTATSRTQTRNEVIGYWNLDLTTKAASETSILMLTRSRELTRLQRLPASIHDSCPVGSYDSQASVPTLPMPISRRSHGAFGAKVRHSVEIVKNR